MVAVLGIDAAWTNQNDSGFALIERIGGNWRLNAAASNIGSFARACGLEAVHAAGFDFAVSCAKHRAGGRLPDLITVDMPLSHRPIIQRRSSDAKVSSRFGAAKCATHSPSATRPGAISDRLHKDCRIRGYRLKTSVVSQFPLALAEVYPHPALLGLMPVSERVPYKVGKTTKYWPGASAQERLSRVRDELRKIARRLDDVIAGIHQFVDVEGPDSFSALKPVEDTLDAIVAAWVGVTILDGAAEPFGDDDSAIWIPRAACAKVAATR